MAEAGKTEKVREPEQAGGPEKVGSVGKEDRADGEDTAGTAGTTGTQQTADPECETCGCEHHAHHGYISEKDRYLRRMKRIEGQARGITKMIEDEKYCIDILTQISALTKALQAVGLGLLDDHLNHCVLNAAKAGGPEAEEKLQEASAAIARLVKS